MMEKNTVWIRAPVETKQKNLIAIRVLWLCRNTLLVFKHSGRKETSRWHTKYFECVCVCVSVFVYSLEYGRFPMWHYVDIHDQLICLTSSLYSQMDPLLEPFSNQPPAPAKPPIFYNFKCFIFGKQIAELDWNQSTYGDLLAVPWQKSALFPTQLMSHKRIQCITKTRHAHIHSLPHLFILGLVLLYVYVLQ